MFPEARVDPEADRNRRYTTREFMTWCLSQAGVSEWDLDVAADIECQWAERWFVAPGDGWWGDRHTTVHRDGCDYMHMPAKPCLKCGAVTTPAAIDGLKQDWLDPKRGQGRNTKPWRIWCNPPFDVLEPWLAKAWETMEQAHDEGLFVVIGMVLPGNRPEQPFWQKHVEPFRDGRAWHRARTMLRSHYPPGRTKYGHPGNPSAKGVGSADFPTVFLSWRNC